MPKRVPCIFNYEVQRTELSHFYSQYISLANALNRQFQLRQRKYFVYFIKRVHGPLASGRRGAYYYTGLLHVSLLAPIFLSAYKIFGKFLYSRFIILFH
jgi:hypothetical protein